MRRHRLLFSVSLILAGTVTTFTPAADWPQWLGPDRDSQWREDGIVERFSDNGPPKRWSARIGGGYAGPAVAGGRVFVPDFTTDKPAANNPGGRQEVDGSERIVCLSVKDGSELWTHEYKCSYAISYPAGPRVTPTVVGDHVYTLGAEGNLFCLKVSDGSVVWSRELKKDYGTESPFWGFCGHPLVDGNKLICLVGGSNSVAVAFDRMTGRELWRSLSAKESGYCPPTLIEAGGTRQLLIWHAQALCSLNPDTGQVYWSEKLEPAYNMSIATPRMLGDYLFVGAIVNQSMMLKLDAKQPAAEVVWRGNGQRGIGPVNSTPFLMDGHMYGVDRQGELRCVDLATGKRLWSTNEPTTGGPRANSATAFIVKNENRFFLFSETGDLIIAKFSPSGYDEISRSHLIEPTHECFGRDVVWSHPAFADRAVFVRNDKEIACFDLGRR